MEPEQTIIETATRKDIPANAPSNRMDTRETLVPQQDEQPSNDCGDPPDNNSNSAARARYVYALGRIEPRFPSLGVEKEFAQATGRAETAGLTDRRALHKVLTQPENRYLLRQLCWVMTIAGLETYLLVPQDASNVELLAEALRRDSGPLDLDLVIGVRGPIAPPEICNGIMLPMVAFDQIYSFERDALIQAVPHPDDFPEEEFQAAAGEVFDRIFSMIDNAGSTDEHRALNYLVVRYPAIYDRAIQSFRMDASLTAVETRPSRLSGSRRIVDVIFAYTHRATDFREKFFVRVDVTDEFPFLITKLSPYFDR